MGSDPLTAGDDRGLAGLPVLPRAFFDRDVLAVAPGLLGCVIVRSCRDGTVAVRLTEVEAYAGAADPASHAFRGKTARNSVMFGDPGHAYVYFTYGMHFCVNLVCGPAGMASAVLLRAGQVVTGHRLAAARRGTGPAASQRDTARGPARLCQALGIDRGMDGTDVCDPASPLRILGQDGPAGEVERGPRAGVSSAAQVRWRFWLAGEPTVSAYRPHVPRKRADRADRAASALPAGRGNQVAGQWRLDGSMHR
jgi:DNA-3-methyladenine glycosylase